MPGHDSFLLADAVNVYIQPGPKAKRYTRLDTAQVDDLGSSLIYNFVFAVTKKTSNRAEPAPSAGRKRKPREDQMPKPPAKRAPIGRKTHRKKDQASETPESDFDFEVEQMAMEEFDLYG